MAGSAAYLALATLLAAACLLTVSPVARAEDAPSSPSASRREQQADAEVYRVNVDLKKLLQPQEQATSEHKRLEVNVLNVASSVGSSSNNTNSTQSDRTSFVKLKGYKQEENKPPGFLSEAQVDAAFHKYAKDGKALSAIGLHLALQHLGIEVSPYDCFHVLNAADKNKDAVLDLHEFRKVLEFESAGPFAINQIELGRTNFIGGVLQAGANAIGGAVSKVAGNVGSAFNRLLGRVDTRNDGCVICQYVIERIMRNVQQSSLAQFNGRFMYLELESTVHQGTEAQSKNPFTDSRLFGVNPVGMGYRQTPGFSIGGGDTMHSGIDVRRGYSAYVRQQERALYNQIYRIMDLTLDDVCEQAMPPTFYDKCKEIYKKQKIIVDGLRYQYRPSDICMDIELCDSGSYIAKGKHARYRQDLFSMIGKGIKNIAGGIGKAVGSVGRGVGNALGMG